jgi:hypothetical protein
MASLLFLLAALSTDPTKSQPAFHDYEREISALFKQESQAKNTTRKAAAVRSLCSVHQRLVRDTRYATSDILKEYRGRVWSRLTKIKAELQRQLGREAANASQLANAAALAAADASQVAAAASLSDSLALLDDLQGGPGPWLARGGGPLVADWGPDLVDLIERTINPAFWDVAGGPGTIIYYRPLQCLVVRATAEVHGQIGGLVAELRDVGR